MPSGLLGRWQGRWWRPQWAEASVVWGSLASTRSWSRWGVGSPKGGRDGRVWGTWESALPVAVARAHGSCALPGREPRAWP